MNKVIKYIDVRIEQLNEERAKNEDPMTQLVMDKAIFELDTVCEMLKRERRLSVEKYPSETDYQKQRPRCYHRGHHEAPLLGTQVIDHNQTNLEGYSVERTIVEIDSDCENTVERTSELEE